MHEPHPVNQMQFFPKREHPSFKNATLVLPAVAWANVGELAIDAIIHNLQLEVVGQLEDLNILPAVGNNPYCPVPAGTLCTALELYHLSGTATFVLQQRAPAALGRQEAAAEVLADWIAQSGFGRVVVLAGLDAQERRDAELDAPSRQQLWYLAGPTLEEATLAAAASSAPGGDPVATSDTLPSTGAAGVQPSQTDAGATPPALTTTSTEATTSDSSGVVPQPDDLSALCNTLPHFVPLDKSIVAEELRAHRLLPPWPTLAALSRRSVPRLLLAVFASEGDNAPDGLQLCRGLLCLLAASTTHGLLPPSTSPDLELVPPCSWALGLYGRMPQLEQYA